jgi:putative heme-binding domain-containing protein
LLKSGRAEPELIAAASALRFKEIPAGLQNELDAVAKNSRLPASARLQALSGRNANTKLDAASFTLLHSQLERSAVPGDRRLALAILSKSALTEEQLMGLAPEVESASPLVIASLLNAFEKGSSEKVGDRLLAGIKKSSALSALTPDHLHRTFEKFPQAIKDRAVAFAASLNSDHTQQSARIEALLPKMKSGDIRRGQAIFNSQTAACSTCHAIGYLGGDLGPDLTRIGQIRTERDLLEAILYPSASFVRSYEPIVVETRDGEQFSGVLKKDATDEMILGTGPGAVARVPRNDIVASRPGKLSVMPQGLDEQLSVEQLADLLAFLKATRW